LVRSSCVRVEASFRKSIPSAEPVTPPEPITMNGVETVERLSAMMTRDVDSDAVGVRTAPTMTPSPDWIAVVMPAPALATSA
jgi:hypothetical protein